MLLMPSFYENADGVNEETSIDHTIHDIHYKWRQRICDMFTCKF